MRKRKLILNPETIRIMLRWRSDLIEAHGGQVKTSNQAGCTDDSGKTVVRTSRC